MLQKTRITTLRKPKISKNGCEFYLGDNLKILDDMVGSEVSLIYIDPPFNTGKYMKHNRVKAVRSSNGTVGYGGNHYSLKQISSIGYDDKFEDYEAFLRPRIEAAYSLLAPNGSFFLHVDCRESHYCKVMMDQIFGRENFMNEIIWSYDYGARSKKKWSWKHDNILWYVKDKDDYIFNYDVIDRIPYRAPDLVGAEKAARGKTPTDVWWNSIIGTNSKEREAGGGYPTQKPLAILNRIVLVHSNEGDIVLDFFAGTGTTGVAAITNNRKAILIDNSSTALKVIKYRIRNGQ